jgi:transcription antitermination factor NusB
MLGRCVMDKRTRAREMTLQALYQLDVRGDEAFETLDGFFREEPGDDYIRHLAAEWTNGTWKNIQQCDAIITASTLKWDLARLACVDRSILRLSVYQLKFCPDIPPKVVINEAVELAKKFGTDKSPVFINGVLDAVMKKLIPSE